MSKSLDTFIEINERATALVDLYKSGHAKRDNDDLLRSATVMSVSGFDRYFTHRFAEVLVVHLKKNDPSKDLLELLHNSGITLSLCIRLLATKQDRPFRTIRNKVQPALFNLTTNQAKTIDTLFKKIEIHNLSDRVKKRSGNARLISRVNHAVQRRNWVAHEGDVNGHYNPRRIHINAVLAWLEALEEFVTLADTIIEVELKKKK